MQFFRAFAGLITARVVTICFASLLAFALAAPMEARAAAYSAIVVDAASGKVLHMQNADQPRYPASLTKMMTLFMAFDALKAGKLTLDQRIPVSAHAAGQEPSSIGLQPGQTIRVRDAILAAVTKSANDATVTLGEAMGGSETKFAEMMTARAHAIGMTSTTFRNASGLPNPKQKTTARDMATLARALLTTHRGYYHYFSTPEFEWNDRVFANHNHLLGKYEGVDGIKTGFIRASGFNLVASAQRDGRRVIGVVFGGTSGPARDARMVQLLDHAFDGDFDNAPVMADSGSSAFGLISSAKAAEAVPPKAAKPRKAAKSKAMHASAAAPKGKAAWAVQLGAYREKAKAQQVVQRASAKLPAAEPAVEATPTENGQLYRARLTGLTEADARSACSTLKRQNLACTVVPSAG